MNVYLAATQQAIISLVKFNNELNKDEFKLQKAMSQVLLEQANVFETLIAETKGLQKGFNDEKQALETQIMAQKQEKDVLQAVIRGLEEMVRGEQAKNSVLERRLQDIDTQDTNVALDMENDTGFQLEQQVANVLNIPALTSDQLKQATSQIDKSIAQLGARTEQAISHSCSRLEQAIANWVKPVSVKTRSKLKGLATFYKVR